MPQLDTPVEAQSEPRIFGESPAVTINNQDSTPDGLECGVFATRNDGTARQVTGDFAVPM
jgi:hypothetical protein